MRFTAIACALGCTNVVVWPAPMLKLDQSMTTSSLFWSICVLFEVFAIDTAPVVTTPLNGLASAGDAINGSANNRPAPETASLDQSNDAEHFRSARNRFAKRIVMGFS